MVEPAPSSGDFTLLFDIARDGYRDWEFLPIGLVFVAIGLVGTLYLRRAGPPPPRRALVLGARAWGIFAILWVSSMGFFTYRKHAALARAFEQGTVEYVEGPVENFVPMPANGHGVERFDVREKHFEYSQNVVTGGFNRTSTMGGPIRPGLHVRVGYVGDTIVRLESRPLP